MISVSEDFCTSISKFIRPFFNQDHEAGCSVFSVKMADAVKLLT